MPSMAAAEFGRARSSAGLLIRAASVRPTIKIDFAAHKTSCLHAALAMLVAAWEAYLERLVQEVQREIADPSQAKLSAVLSLLSAITQKETARFNTPSSDNSRELLIKHTGYDPINDWYWPKGQLSGVQARARLDEILKIRHSFAHGFSVPTNISWVKDRNRPGVLNVGALVSVDQFLTHLVFVTDRGMAAHLLLTYGVQPSW